MYCSSCGTQASETHRFCTQCGTSFTGSGASAPPPLRPTRALTRPRQEAKIAGVCAGIARYLSIDVTLVRVIMVVLALWPPGTGLLLYLVCWIIMPRDPLLLPPPAPNSTYTAPVQL